MGSDLCDVCGGHGTVIAGEITPETPDLTDDERARLARRQARGNPNPLLRSRVCRWCDGQDRVTPMLEAQAEDHG